MQTLSLFSNTLNRSPFFSISTRFFCNLSRMSQSTRFVAEYAEPKSSCKKCSNAIDAKTLMLGSVTRDHGGSEATKWHHLDCFALGSDSISSAHEIEGFGSLKGSDQEALKELVDSMDTAKDEVEKQVRDEENEPEEINTNKEKVEKRVPDEENEPEEMNTKEEKVGKRVQDEGNEPEEMNTKKAKWLSTSESILDVKTMYKDAKLGPKWKAFETTIFRERDDGLNDSSKIAAFDFDGCLANTNVKRCGADAWSLMYPSIPDKMQSLYNDGYKLVIFTNESNIERWIKKRQSAVDSKIGRLNGFIEMVKVPIQVFIACGTGKTKGPEDQYRKPKPGMWHLMEKHFNSGITIDMDQSFYVGDAAGRKKDHSDADIKFAKTIGLKFYVPEDYFDTKR